MRICHLIVNEFFPMPGGLQFSAYRVMEIINSLEGWHCEVYVRSDDFPKGNCASAGIHWISPQRMELVGAQTAARSDLFRAEFLVLRDLIGSCVNSSQPDAFHVILSYYLTETGFLGQQLALSLGLPHITSFRGTDFSRDLLDPARFSSLDYVIRGATAIVTTNKQQELFLRRAYGTNIRVMTIHNSVPAVTENWVAKRRPYVLLVADCGYCFKKGTNILVNAFCRLRHEGLPVRLWLCGPTEQVEARYWSECRDNLKRDYGDLVALHDVMERSEVEHALLESDIYCSATLGEGCSQSRATALTLGVPIVSTKCGELADLLPTGTHVLLSTPGNSVEFLACLRRNTLATIEEELRIDTAYVEQSREVFSPALERAEWAKLLTDLKALIGSCTDMR